MSWLARTNARLVERERGRSWSQALKDTAIHAAGSAIVAATLQHAFKGQPWFRSVRRAFGGVLLGGLLPRTVVLAADRLRRTRAARDQQSG